MLSNLLRILSGTTTRLATYTILDNANALKDTILPDRVDFSETKFQVSFQLDSFHKIPISS